MKLAQEQHRTVSELLETNDSQELAEWRAYYNIFPFAVDRADINNAMQCATSANAMSTGRRAKMSDFLIDYEREARKKTRTAKDRARDIRDAMQLWTLVAGNPNAGNR